MPHWHRVTTFVARLVHVTVPLASLRYTPWLPICTAMLRLLASPKQGDMTRNSSQIGNGSHLLTSSSQHAFVHRVSVLEGVILPAARRSLWKWLIASGLLGGFSAAAFAQASNGIVSDGNVVMITTPGGLMTPSLSTNGGGAGAIVLQQGASQGAAPTGSIQITAPDTIQAYTLKLPTSGPDAAHPLLAFGADGTGYFTALPASTTSVMQSTGVLTGAQTINGGSSSLPLVITSNNANGASIALDNSSSGGNYTLLYSNSARNAGLWDYTHFRDTLTCSETDGAVSCGSTHVVSTSGQPILTTGSGAGSAASAYFETGNANAPSDQSGVITVTTGSSPNANAVIAAVNFTQPWLRTIASQTQATAYAPACTISPANGTAASLTGSDTAYAAVASSSAFAIFSNSNPLPSNTTYSWTYKCM